MEDTMVYKNKIKIFTSVAMVINYLLYLVEQFISLNFIATDSPLESYKAQGWTSLSSFVFSLITFVMIFFIGKALTNDKMKTAVYTGSAYFSLVVSNTIATFVKEICTFLIMKSVLPETFHSYSDFVSYALCIPLQIVITYTFFTASTGINENFASKGIGSFKTTPKQAKKNYIIYLILSAVVASVFSLSSFLHNLEFIPTSVIMILTPILSFLTDAMPLVVLYLVGYKSKNSNPEAMAFSATDCLVTTVADLIFTLPIIAVLFIRDTFIPEDIMSNAAQYSSATSIAGAVISGISLICFVVSIVMTFRMLDKVFAKTKKAETEEPEPASLTEDETAE